VLVPGADGEQWSNKAVRPVANVRPKRNINLKFVEKLLHNFFLEKVSSFIKLPVPVKDLVMMEIVPQH